MQQVQQKGPNIHPNKLRCYKMIHDVTLKKFVKCLIIIDVQDVTNVTYYLEQLIYIGV